MQGRRGDEIVVRPPVLGTPSRRAEVVEVIDEGERPDYRVIWDDDHESVEDRCHRGDRQPGGPPTGCEEPG